MNQLSPTDHPNVWFEAGSGAYVHVDAEQHAVPARLPTKDQKEYRCEVCQQVFPRTVFRCPETETQAS